MNLGSSRALLLYRLWAIPAVPSRDPISVACLTLATGPESFTTLRTPSSMTPSPVAWPA